MPGTGVTITNPLVLYRSLIATQKIRPDPAQHRLGTVTSCISTLPSIIASTDLFSVTLAKAIREIDRL
jgi:hypothetical protein